MSSLPRSQRAGVASAAVAALMAVAGAAVAQDGGRFGFGRIATPEQIAGWDIDVRPDGHGVRKGRGNARDGQVIYDAQCASCHGTFGESNLFMVIAGGVSKGDLQAGRAASLKSGEVRTVGNKLNRATTLWDYIYRAMPWAAPQSLSVDEVYAVTAYVLYLNDIVPGDFELNDRNLVTLPMPNRYGMTLQHGMASVSGKPDVQGSLCMKNCVSEVKISSELPEHARHAHGNLAEQKRPLGPMRGIDTTRYESGRTAARPVLARAPAASAGPSAQDVVKRQACVACHAVNSRGIGPGFVEIGSKYASRADAESHLVGRMKAGSVGIWGQIPMPAQPDLKDDEARAIARWILGGAR